MLVRLESLRYVLRQGLSVRSHDEIDGNFIQLLILRQGDVPELKQWLHNKQYMPPTIINELITLLGHQVLKSLISDIKQQQWYSIIGNEVTDITNKEQFNISIRYVS